MKRNRSYSGNLTSQETIGGIVYLAFQLFLLPGILTWVNGQLATPLNDAEINFVYYMINFIAILLIFHGFLERGLNHVTHNLAIFCQAVILGYVAYYACNRFTTWAVGLLVPGFSNYNDEAIFEMSRGNAFLMMLCTVVLVPPFEECMYRGLVFRNLYSRNKILAYTVSILLFSAIHILGYLGRYAPLELAMAVLQYLPAGLCLAWSYAKADTIFAPIFMHAAINYITIRTMR